VAGGSSSGQPDATVAGCVIDVYIFFVLTDVLSVKHNL
jgi:hypothetical protein